MTRQQRYRINHPDRYAYQALKDNAKRRGKEFKLTFEQFKAFAVRTDYMRRRGVTATSYHIDRIDENKGYTVDNIQVLENSANVKKFFKHWWDGTKYVFRFESNKQKENEAPF